MRRLLVLLGVWLCCASQWWTCANAWPRFFRGGHPKAPPAQRVTGYQGFGSPAAAPPPLLYAGAAERAEQARALWQEVEAKGRLSPCWKRSLLLLQAKCAAVQQDDTMRSRLALFMATCDADSDGRSHPNFHCGTTSAATMSGDSVRACVQALADDAYTAFLQYRLHADVLCAYLQEELYQERTEAAVAAMQQRMEESVAALDALQRSGASVAEQAARTQAMQLEAQSATLALRQQLAALQGGHSAALDSLRAAADDILRTSTATDATLERLHTRLQETAAEAMAAVAALSEQSVLQLSAVEEQTRGVARLMAQLDHVQQLLSRPAFSWHRLAGTALAALTALAATSAPRTAAARLPAAALTLAGVVGLPLLERCLGDGLWMRWLPQRAWWAVCAAAAVAVVGRAAVVYTPADGAWQRRVVQEEAVRVWAELQRGRAATPPSPLMPWASRLLTQREGRTEARSPSPRPPAAYASPPPQAAPLATPLSIAVSPLDVEVTPTEDAAESTPLRGGGRPRVTRSASGGRGQAKTPRADAGATAASRAGGRRTASRPSPKKRA